MATEIYILTLRDFAVLKNMCDHRCMADDPIIPALLRKIRTAKLVSPYDVPRDVATLNSRVSFSVSGRDFGTRVIAQSPMASPVGMSLPITTSRGLALLGLREGQEFVIANRDGTEERILLTKVRYQPEAARRGKLSVASVSSPSRPFLRLIHGNDHERPSSPEGSERHR